ncbi:16S rRNA (cytosine(967)-C(5))-methyltransferase RsmB [bacterium]|nr:16S rRNA (cytosine(967)-C(5))-methyltransferase RsmB [bacterium]
MNARELALLSLAEWESGSGKIDTILDRQLTGAGLDSRDVALTQNIVFGTLRMKGRIDWVLNQYVKGGLKSLPLPIRNALRLGLYQIDFLDRIPPRAAVNESVTLARRYGHKGTAGLVNAVLRNILTGMRPDFPDIETDPVGHISAAHSHPRVLIARWVERYGMESTITLCEYNNIVPRLVVRTNALSVTREGLASALDGEGVVTRPGRYFDECLELEGAGDITRLTAFTAGLMQVQDEGTLAAVKLLDPKPGERVIDVCAAPGGKTTYIAELMRGKGRVLAFEISRRRAEMLRSNIERLHVPNCEVLCGEATSDVTDAADAVLVDAPCTGTGTLSRRPDSKWKFDLEARDKSKAEIEDEERYHPTGMFSRQASRQLRLLLQAANMMREAGRIVYSTCSLEPEENEQVVERFLVKRDDFVLDDAARYVPGMFVDGGYARILPHKHGIDGAFAARLVRKTIG